MYGVVPQGLTKAFSLPDGMTRQRFGKCMSAGCDALGVDGTYDGGYSPPYPARLHVASFFVKEEARRDDSHKSQNKTVPNQHRGSTC